MPHSEYHARRKIEALPRWKEAFTMRQSGQKLREIDGIRSDTSTGKSIVIINVIG